MKLLKKILVPIDINMDSGEQIKTTIKIAKLCDSEITILYVLRKKNLKESVKEILTKTVTKELKKVEDIFNKEGISVKKPVIKYGKPVTNIIEMAISEDANLILIGSGNKDKKGQFKRGSVAEKLMRESVKPVWVAKSDKENKFNNILCPVDFSDPSRNALKNAILFSKFFNANLSILGVYEVYTSFSPRLKVDVEGENLKKVAQFKAEMQEFIKEFDLQGVNYDLLFESGTADVEILKTIKENDFDLLIIGTHGRTGVHKLILGSTTEKVTRVVPCSFITTKTEQVIQFKYDDEVEEIGMHFKRGNDLFKNKAYREALGQYLICLEINKLHIPSIFRLSELFKAMGDDTKSKKYSDMAKGILDKLWDEKIEQKIRKHYLSED